MKQLRRIFILIIGAVLTFNSPVIADDKGNIKEDNPHVRRWNGFANNLLKLHHRLIKENAVTKKTSTGGYAGQPNFYKEEAFYSKSTGKIISRVQWEKELPEQMHTIEVYFYDKKGRIARDYSAAYLPTYRNAPSQTLINIHAYNNNTQAFRSFDASGAHVLDRCEGKYKGKDVNILLDEDDLYNELDGVRLTPEYKACVKGLPESVGVYLVPQ
ncbi:MAG: hypothetical protein OEY00_03975 [Gammaproteobacteria bacterium]|nr:hypothetical protein [Gammaproteobacteria bacterium]